MSVISAQNHEMNNVAEEPHIGANDQNQSANEKKTSKTKASKTQRNANCARTGGGRSVTVALAIFAAVFVILVTRETEAKPAFYDRLLMFDKPLTMPGEDSLLLNTMATDANAPPLLQRRSFNSEYASRRSAHPCRWKLCGAYHNYSNFRRFL